MVDGTSSPAKNDPAAGVDGARDQPRRSSGNFLPLYILIVLYPLAVAAQNLGSAILGAYFIIDLYRSRNSIDWLSFISRFRWPLLFSTAFLVWLSLATALNESNSGSGLVRFGFGYLVWAFLPACLVLKYGPSLPPYVWRRMVFIAAGVSAVWAAIVLSQSIWGWKISGVTIVDAPNRARGLYSHPLTLAYAAILVFPFSLFNVVRNPRSWAAWVLVVSIGILILASQSRMVQLVAVACSVMILTSFLRGRSLKITLAGLVLTCLGIAFTNNPVSERFLDSLEHYDTQSGYANDRLAFWHVHWQMILERPFVGHGVHLNTAYREPYYRALGLGGFQKKYEAHSMVIQVAANGGLIGFVLFVAWWLWCGKVAWSLDPPFHRVFLITYVAFLIAGLTQNAFQDSEVRFGLSLLTCCLWLRKPK